MCGAAGPGGAADEENTTSKPPLVDDVGGQLTVKYRNHVYPAYGIPVTAVTTSPYRVNCLKGSRSHPGVVAPTLR